MRFGNEISYNSTLLAISFPDPLHLRKYSSVWLIVKVQ